MAGRKPKPTAIKQLQGNPGKRPLNNAEPQYPDVNVRVPKGKLPKDAQLMWRAVAPLLASAGVLTEADLPALEMLSLHYAVARAALAEMIRDGHKKIIDDEEREYTISEGIATTTTTADGSIKKHPAASVFRENSLAFRGYLGEFGLTPAARVKIKVGGQEREQSLAEMLFEAVYG
jgi:P27 family predicted phage terminase small subunit